jgi:hypothetical protein
MSDTQWSNAADAANNPGTVAVGIINQLNQQFINNKVKFVVQVGDLVDKETNYSGLPQSPRLGISTRAAAAKALYDQGIGFFPLRGNHEGSATGAVEVQSNFPQTKGGANSVGATAFSSPSGNLAGLSYSFGYNNARFTLLDQFTPTDGLASDGSAYNLDNNAIASQQAWISSSLLSRPINTHAFVFSHKQLFGGNHNDTLFGSPNTSSAGFTNPQYFSQVNAFIGALNAANVAYLFTGHDHMHNLSIVTSPDGDSRVRQVICASDSYKFYTPQGLAAHGTDALGDNAGQIAKNRELEIAQELWSVGYYIVTVDGPRVTVDFHSADPTPEIPGLADVDLKTTPNLTFSKRATFGYSLNGQEVRVPEGKSYEVTDNTSKAIALGETGYLGTAAAILEGVNKSMQTDYNGRPFTKAVNTGWAPAETGLASDILTLWGMADLGTDQADTVVLSLSFDKEAPRQGLGNGAFGIATRDAAGKWVNAVDLNFGGTKTFVKGPWKAGYALGAYGVDASKKTAWAVINRNGEFAVAAGIEAAPGQR